VLQCVAVSCSVLQYFAVYTVAVRYGVATISKRLKIIGMFCRISSLLWVSFAKETYNLIDPTNQSHPIHASCKKSVFHPALPCCNAPVSVCCSMLQCVSECVCATAVPCCNAGVSDEPRHAREYNMSHTCVSLTTSPYFVQHTATHCNTLSPCFVGSVYVRETYFLWALSQKKPSNIEMWLSCTSSC